MRTMEPVVLYTRMLPGGGMVTIESLHAEGASVRAMLRVERRGDPGRRRGHSPPVIMERAGSDREEVFGELYKVAADNVAIARHLIAWQSRHESGGAAGI